MEITSRPPIVFVEGRGSWLRDASGKPYLDFIQGWAVNCLGHCPDVITRAINAQAAQLLNCSPSFYNAPMVRLADLIAEKSGLQKTFFTNSGAEAIEGAIKLARKWGKQHRGGAYEIITMDHGFHGRTLAAVTATGQEKYQHGFEPLVPGFKHVPYNDLRAMERAIDSRTAAVLVEPIQGEGGVRVPDDDYLPGLRKLCDAAGALLILDEIQTGVGRTGRLWAYEHAGIEPDIMTLAKALANGVPIGATLAREEVAAVLTPGTHGSTFGGTPFVTAVALAAFTTVLADRIPERAARMGRELMEGLRAIQSRQPIVREVRGKGLLIGMDLTVPAGPIVDRCRDAGLLVLSAGEKVLRLAPPLIVESRDAARALEIIERALPG